MTTEQTIYKVPAVNFARLEAEVEKMNKRAERLETEPVVLRTHGTEVRTLRDALLDTEYFEETFLCTIEGAAPQLEGYFLIAEIKPVENEENLVREVPGQQCPKQFRTTDMRCDHCHTLRNRKSVFIVANEFGEFVRVGRSCLQDYLGGKSPEALIKRAEYMMDFDELVRNAVDPEWGPSQTKYVAVPTSRFVQACAVVIRKMGWVSRTQAHAGEGRATADIAWDICVHCSRDDVRKMVEQQKLQVNGDDAIDAERAIEWAEKIDPENAPNNYLHDLGVCCRQKHVTWERAGYVGSVINAYRRHLADQARDEQQAQESASEYLGTVGETGEFSVRIMEIKPLQPFGNTPKNLIVFNTAAGDVLCWFKSGDVPEWAKIGSEVTISGRIKSHKEFNGVKQTNLIYVKTK